KEMLRQKLNEIEAYNASKGRAAVNKKGEGSANTTKEKRARCYICRKRGHVFWKCPNKKNRTIVEVPAKDNNSKKPTVMRTEEKLKYPERVHVKTDYMIEAMVETSEKKIIIPCVLYTLEITLNVLSLDQLMAQRFVVTYGHNKCQISYMFEEDKEGCDGETDCATSKEGNGCDVETESMIAKHNKYLEEYFDSIDSKDACPLIKGLEDLNWDTNEVQDYLDEDYISMNGTLYAIKKKVSGYD
ncbi:ARID DNA-binding domain-containing protein, partial [Tanacetum coccineum]